MYMGQFRPIDDACAMPWAVLVQVDALLINHIAPGRRTLAPSA
jgi:hypothetical protein